MSSSRHATLIGNPTNFYIQHADHLDLTRAHPSPAPSNALLLRTRSAAVLIDPAKTALVIIDMQNFFLSPALGRKEGAGYAAARRLESHAVPAARKAGIRTLWLNWGLTDDDLAAMPAGVKRVFGDPGEELEIEAKIAASGEGVGSEKDARLYRGLGSEMGTVDVEGTEVDAGRALMRNQWNAALFEPLDKLWGQGRSLVRTPDVWIHKDRMSGMWGARTECEDFLTSEGLTTLLFAGVNTDQCVAGTLIDAASKGYDCILLADGCGTTSPACAQEAVEFNAAKSWGFLSDCEALTAAVDKMKG